jgi:hypothetical protein
VSQAKLLQRANKILSGPAALPQSESKSHMKARGMHINDLCHDHILMVWLLFSASDYLFDFILIFYFT